MVRNTRIIHKWYFPIFAIGAMGLFYANDNTSITATGSIIIMILTFIGMAVTERLDKIIMQNDSIIVEMDEVEENIRSIGFKG